MGNEEILIVFGPVPSRRLGQSLGINNIPPKICTYSCVYCQLGRTKNMMGEREEFYDPNEVAHQVIKKIEHASIKRENIEYLTFVPDGEPTLDINLGRTIELLKPLGIKIAVITNASLIYRKDVRNELAKADRVSLKIDVVDLSTWKNINRPYKKLSLDDILNGMSEFASSFNGDLDTETMLIKNINDNVDELELIAEFIATLKPNKGYLSIPTRPPAESWVEPANENNINIGYQIFKENNIDVEYLISYEGNAFAFTGDIVQDLLSITSVHPMREDGIKELLTKANEDWGIIEMLINENKLVETEYNGKNFYLRKLPDLKMQ
jgi:wyosine [tRNA(Phe)-imidazoG37] synthetase (radical SAM superfamily)